MGAEREQGKFKKRSMKKDYSTHLIPEHHQLRLTERNAFNALLIKADKAISLFECTQKSEQDIVECCNKLEAFARPYQKNGESLEHVIENLARQARPLSRPSLAATEMLDEAQRRFAGDPREPSHLPPLIDQLGDIENSYQIKDGPFITDPLAASPSQKASYLPKIRMAIVTLYENGISLGKDAELILTDSDAGNFKKQKDQYALISIPSHNVQIAICERAEMPTYISNSIRRPKWWRDATPAMLHVTNHVTTLPATANPEEWKKNLGTGLDGEYPHDHTTAELTQLCQSLDMFTSPRRLFLTLVPDFVKSGLILPHARAANTDKNVRRLWQEYDELLNEQCQYDLQSMLEGQLLRSCEAHEKDYGHPPTITDQTSIPGWQGVTWKQMGDYLSRPIDKRYGTQLRPAYSLDEFTANPPDHAYFTAQQIARTAQTPLLLTKKISYPQFMQLSLHYLEHHDMFPSATLFAGPDQTSTFWQRMNYYANKKFGLQLEEIYNLEIGEKQKIFSAEHKRPARASDGKVSGWGNITWAKVLAYQSKKLDFNQSPEEAAQAQIQQRQQHDIYFQTNMLVSPAQYVAHNILSIPQQNRRWFASLTNSDDICINNRYTTHALRGTPAQLFLRRLAFCMQGFIAQFGRPPSTADGVITGMDKMTWDKANAILADLDPTQPYLTGLEKMLPTITSMIDDTQWNTPVLVPHFCNKNDISKLWQHHVRQTGREPLRGQPGSIWSSINHYLLKTCKRSLPAQIAYEIDQLKGKYNKRHGHDPDANASRTEPLKGISWGTLLSIRKRLASRLSVVLPTDTQVKITNKSPSSLTPTQKRLKKTGKNSALHKEEKLRETDAMIFNYLSKELLPTERNPALDYQSQLELGAANGFLKRHHNTTIMGRLEFLMKEAARTYPTATGPSPDHPSLSWEMVNQVLVSQTRNRFATNLFNVLDMCGPPPPVKSATKEYARANAKAYYYEVVKGGKKPGPG